MRQLWELRASGTQAKFVMGTRKFARDDHHHLEADAHLDAAAVTPFRALLCPPTERKPRLWIQ